MNIAALSWHTGVLSWDWKHFWEDHFQTAVRKPMPLAGSEWLLVGTSLAWEWATAIERHWTHSSAFLPSLGFKIRERSPVKISNAFGMFLAPLLTFTLLIWFTSIGIASLSFCEQRWVVYQQMLATHKLLITYCASVCKVCPRQSEISSAPSFENFPSTFLFFELPFNNRLSCL